MGASQWLNKAKKNGWRVLDANGRSIVLACSKQGCPGRIERPLIALGDPPPPCELPHVGQYSHEAFDGYRELVAELVRRRRSLGMSQEDLCAASGLADGHINKLESFDRTAQFPTLKLWADTLGLDLTLQPKALPPATIRTIERRPAPLRENKKWIAE